jgi:hypothetical protein
MHENPMQNWVHFGGHKVGSHQKAMHNRPMHYEQFNCSSILLRYITRTASRNYVRYSLIV